MWHYRYLPSVGDNVDIEFVDTCMCGDFHATLDRSEKDALKYTPGAGATMYKQMGMAKREDRRAANHAGEGKKHRSSRYRSDGMRMAQAGNLGEIDPVPSHR